MPDPTIREPVFTLTSGPVDAYPAVLRGLSRTIHYDYDPVFLAFYEQVNEKARAAMRAVDPAGDPAWRAGAGAGGRGGLADRRATTWC